MPPKVNGYNNEVNVTDIPKPDYLKAYFTAELPTEGLPSRFGIVTAFNAQGQSLTEEINRRADRLLRQYLVDAGLKHFRVTGGSRDGSHVEPGFGIVVESADAIRSISKRFDQDAFFWFDDGVIFVVNTGGAILHRLGPWVNRQK